MASQQRASSRLCQHGQARAQQRGIRFRTIDFILEEADIDLHAGDGCSAYRLSKAALSEHLRSGDAVTTVERARDLVVIVEEASGEIVTVLHDIGRRGRRYRRQWPTRGARLQSNG